MYPTFVRRMTLILAESKRRIFVNGVGYRQRALGQRQARDYEQVQDVFSIHEHDLASFRGIQLAAQPVAGSLGDFATRDDESVIDQNALADFGIEYLVS